MTIFNVCFRWVRIVICPAFFSFTMLNLSAQEVPVDVSTADVNIFLDELANEKVIDLFSAIKPYTRTEVCRYLRIADSLRSRLNQRQQKELDLYLLEFSGGNAKKPLKPGVQWRWLTPSFRYYKGNASMIIRPLYGFENTTNKGYPFYSSRGGASFIFGKGMVSAYANLTDNYENREVSALPGYLVPEQGGNYKFNAGGRPGGDYSEMKGGVILSWKWGRIGLVKDQVQWGDQNFGGLILSGRNPSVPMINLHVQPFKWFTLDYIHAWLVSEVIDSSSSYFSQPGIFRGVYQPKYLAANMFTFRPVKNLYFSIGNSIVYSDVPVQIVYLIPVLFYKSVDHTLNHGLDNHNSQMFLNISSRNLKHLHIYGSIFVDEFSIQRVKDPARFNFFGYKAGISLTNWPLKNLRLDAECTVVYPMVYKHRVASLTYASNKYNLGYYMGDNSFDLNISLRYSPLACIYTVLQYGWAARGDDYDYVVNYDLDRHAPLANIIWQREKIIIRTVYRPVAGLELYAQGMYSNVKTYDGNGLTASQYLVKYTPNMLRGENYFFTAGCKIGF